MTHASLFSGIGGPEVAAQMLGWDNIFHCEINPFGRAILEYHFPNSVSYEDITKTDFTRWNGRVDVLTGGFPCQPFSYAGKRGGANDDRYLWPQMLRAISECRPTWVIGENVAGITTMVEQSEIVTMGEQAALFGEADTLRSYELRQRFTIERVCTDLENIGYAVQPMLIPACAVGAPHRRDRVFIIATDSACDGGRTQRANGKTKGKGCELPQQGKRRKQTERTDGLSEVLRHAADTDRKGRKEPKQPGRGAHSSKAGAGMDDRTQRHGCNGSAPFTDCEMLEGRQRGRAQGHGQSPAGSVGHLCGDADVPGARWQGFPTVSPVHRGNDGLPFNVDDLTIPFNQWRTESLKAYGNAIVPQVMYEIFRAIEIITL